MLLKTLSTMHGNASRTYWRWGRNSSLSNRSLWEETDHPWLVWVELWAFIWDIAPVRTRLISFLTNFSLPISLQPGGVKTPKLKNLVCITGYNPILFIQDYIAATSQLAVEGEGIGALFTRFLRYWVGPPENIELLDVNIFSKKVNYRPQVW